jgi:hypothetical protein
MQLFLTFLKIGQRSRSHLRDGDNITKNFLTQPALLMNYLFLNHGNNGIAATDTEYRWQSIHRPL